MKTFILIIGIEASLDGNVLTQKCSQDKNERMSYADKKELY